MKWTAAGDRALRDAIVTLERGSAVEVVVAIRAHARRYLVPHAIASGFAAAALIGWMLAHDTTGWPALVLPLAAAIATALIIELVAPLERLIAPAPLMARFVREAANHAFVDRGVHATSGRTGLLVFVALRERLVCLVGDIAVVDKVGQAALDRWAAELARSLPQGGEAFAAALAARATELASALPRGADDVNELPDQVARV